MLEKNGLECPAFTHNYVLWVIISDNPKVVQYHPLKTVGGVAFNRIGYVCRENKRAYNNISCVSSVCIWINTTQSDSINGVSMVYHAW